MPALPKPATLTETVTAELKSQIMGGALVPDERYTAGQLAETLGVSRTPVREALLELSRLGLVEIEKNRGVRILSSSPSTFIEIYQLRLMLEIPLARRAVALATAESVAEVDAAYASFSRAADAGDTAALLRADRDFHDALLRGADNRRALDMLRQQRDLVLDTGVGTVPASRSAAECFADHADVYAAFKAGDQDALARAMGRHIVNTAQILMRQEAGKRPEFGTVDTLAALSWLVD